MNARYNAGRDAQARGEIKWVADDIEAVLVDVKQYKFSASHRTVANVTGIVSTAKLPGRTVDAGGYCRAGEIRFAGAKGDEAGAVVFYKKNGPLLAYIDAIEKFPVRLNGGDILISGDFIYRI